MVGNRTERLCKYTSSLTWPRRPQSHQVAGLLFVRQVIPEGEESTATYPSGKGEVCKTFMHRFESGRRL